MSEASIDPRYLEVFPQWLRSLGEDAGAVGDAARRPTRRTTTLTRSLVAGLNYIFKSLDLIPDGIDDLGFLDDAFVLRVACALAVDATPEAKQGVVQRLDDDARAVRTSSATTTPASRPTCTACARARPAAARSTTSSTDAQTREQFLQEVHAWSAAYQVPSFTRDQKTLVKLKAFLNAKLP